MTPSQNPTIQSIRQVLFDTAVGLKNGTINQACANSIAEIARLFIQSFDTEPVAPSKNTLGIPAPDKTTEQNQTSGNAPCPTPDRQQNTAPTKPAIVHRKQVSPSNAEPQAIQRILDQGVMEIFVKDFLNVRAKKTNDPFTMDEANKILDQAREKNLTVEEIIAIHAGWVQEDWYATSKTPNPLPKTNKKTVATQPDTPDTPAEKPLPTNSSVAKLPTIPTIKKPDEKSPATVTIKLGKTEKNTQSLDDDDIDKTFSRKTITGGIETVEKKNGLTVRTHRFES